MGADSLIALRTLFTRLVSLSVKAQELFTELGYPLDASQVNVKRSPICTSDQQGLMQIQDGRQKRLYKTVLSFVVCQCKSRISVIAANSVDPVDRFRREIMED